MSATRLVAASLVVSMAASIGLVATFLAGGQAQVEGVLLAVALGSLGVGIVAWAVRLLDAPTVSQERHPVASTAEDRTMVAGEADVQRITRRTLLVRLLMGAAGTLAAALAIPALSLGPPPGRALFNTPWRAGARLVTDDGRPVRPEDLALDSVRTVFPEGEIGSADAVTLLIKVRPSDLRLDADRNAWAPDGCVGYSKICTHAGCPVGLYRADDHVLICPCHQSTFEVLRGAVPVFGPAARALPQLPIEVDGDGFLVARGDFSEPVGPAFWNLTHRPSEGSDEAPATDGGDE